MAFNIIKLIVLSLAIMGSTNAAHAGDLTQTYRCSLKVESLNGGVELTVPDQIVEIPAASAEQPYGTEIFKHVSKSLKDIVFMNVYFMVKSERGQLDLGIYYFNKMVPEKKKLQTEASGDARAYAKLNTVLQPSQFRVHVSCRHIDYR